MAVHVDDKLLGEKAHYYCSSSSEDEDDSKVLSTENDHNSKDLKSYATNTGPKGVINDFRRYKQLENEKKEEQELERLQILKKIQITCRSDLDDKNEKLKDEEFELNLEDILEDEFMQEYRKKRIEEMRIAYQNLPKFGKVYQLEKENYLNAIDKEHPSVTIIIHVYEENIDACNAMNGCLQCLAKEFSSVKFCCIKASNVKLSKYFSSFGVPALLVYKNGQLIGNFVQLSRELGNDFFSTDVEDFLLSHGFLPDRKLDKAIMKCGIDHPCKYDSDTDLD